MDGTSTAVFTVSLSDASAQPITVRYATGDDVASAPGDYTALALSTLIFNPGETSKTVTVSVRGDETFEPDETFFLNLTNPTNATLLAPQGKGTIINDDPIPGIGIDDVSVAEGEAGDASVATFTVSLSNPSSLPITVRYATADGTAAANQDYAPLAPAMLTFAPGEVSKTVSVQITGDALSETDETFFVNLSSPGNARIADAQGVGTIMSDDPIPGISIDDITVTEGDAGFAMATFTIRLSNAFEDIVTVQLATEDGTAVAPDDYEAIGMEMPFIVFLPGNVSTSASVLVRGDTLSEPNETFSLVLSGAFNATISKAQGRATIVDDDPLPGLSIENAAATEGNTGTSAATFIVRLSAPSGQAISVDYATSDGTGIASADYVAIASGALTFAPGETSKTITVDILGDAVFEPDETFFLNLSNATNATLANAQAVATIVNDDPVPSLSIDDVTILEGSTGTSAATFTVRLSGLSSEVVTVQYATADGSAMSPADYNPLAPGTLAFAPGETSKMIAVDIFGDTAFEPDERFFLHLSNPANAILADAQGVAIIVNDDPTPLQLPSLSIDDVTILEGGTGTSAATFVVRLSEPGSETVTVQYVTADGTAASPADYAALGLSTLTFAPGETAKAITVDVFGDRLVEPAETFSIMLSNASGATLVRTIGVATIRNDDVAIAPLANGGVSFADVDGDLVTVTTTKGMLSAANFTFDADGNLQLLDLASGANAAAFAGAKLTIAAQPCAGGDGLVNVGRIDASGLSLKAVKVDGGLGGIDAGEGLAGQPALKKLLAKSVGGEGFASSESMIAGTLGTLKISGDVKGVLNVTGGVASDPGTGGNAVRALGKAVIGGNLDGRAGGAAAGLLRANGDIGSVKVQGSVIGGADLSGIASGGSVGKIKIGGDLTSDDPDRPVRISALGAFGASNQKQAVALGQVSVGGNLLNAEILAGFRSDGTPFNAGAGIGKIIVDGNWTASSAAAGVEDATGDGFGINDALIGGGSGILARIASITIGGAATGSDRDGDHFGITAEQIGKLKIAGNRQPLGAGNGDSISLAADFRVFDFA